MLLLKVTEGMTGQQTADAIYTNDQNLLNAVDVMPTGRFTEILGVNLYDPADPNVLVDAYINATGVYTPAEGYNSTGFIAVTAGQNYTSTYPGAFVTWYDKEGAFIGATTSASFATNKYVTAPVGAAFARFIFLRGTSYGVNQTLYFTISKGTAILSGSDIIYPKYAPFERALSVTGLNIGGSNMLTKSVSPKHATFFRNGKNLFNPSDPDVVLGGYYGEDNTPVVSAGYNQSGLIPVVAGDTYTSSFKSVFVLWYGAARTFLTSTPSAEFTANVVAPAGAYYARFISTAAAWATFQVERAAASTAYEAYYELIREEYLPGGGSSLPENFTSFGDSITFQNQWQPYIVEYFGITHTKLGVGSSSLAYHEASEALYPSFVNAARIQAVKDSNPDILTIMGGANDYSYQNPIGTDAQYALALGAKDIATYKGAYSFLIETFLTWKPTLQIIILSPMQTSYRDSYAISQKSYADAARSVADNYALPFIDAYAESGISKFNNAAYTSDGIHPNATGGRRLANLVISKLKNLYAL